MDLNLVQFYLYVECMIYKVYMELYVRSWLLHANKSWTNAFKFLFDLPFNTISEPHFQKMLQHRPPYHTWDTMWSGLSPYFHALDDLCCSYQHEVK